jgi:hypothetical protein
MTSWQQGVTLIAEGSQLSPAGVTTIAQCPISAVAGQVYRVDVTIYVDGTTSPTEADNFQIAGVLPVNPITLPYNIGASTTGGPTVQYSFNVQSNMVGSAQIQIRTAGAGTASSKYHAILSMTPIIPLPQEV